ncbi:MAG: 23S rRNA (guanosine(2251)-2'-O)-methyltransferase RlmB [Truepera sp.]|nr:23S rRNA (guanosine(2251)-2'-O)-methyltransferase RlmB [Truepera sp.]
MIIYGRQAVREALWGSGQVERLLLADGIEAKVAREFERLAAKAGIPTDTLPRIVLDRALGTARHQGIAAELAEVEISEPEAPFELATQRGEPLLLVVLDQIQDPRNYGAIIRSAEALGAHGVVSEQRRNAPLSAVAVKAAAGATAHLPIVQVTNIVHYLKALKRRSLWVYGAAGEATSTPDAVDWDLDLALVIGSEGRGLRRLVRDTCDELIGIPLRGRVGSLNASVATGILLHTIQTSRTKIS